MATLTYEDLRTAMAAGGPTVVTSVTELAAAAGPHASVAPAKFASTSRGDKGGAYAYEQRFVEREPRRVVIIDSKQSQLNRAETTLQHAIEDGHAVLSKVPHVVVTYRRDDGRAETFTDLTLPHRAFDGHVRAGTVDGVNVTSTATYRAVRDASPSDARALLEFSPITLVFGGWDASRKSRQGRWRSALVGEIIGVLADQHPDGKDARRGGARVDPVAMQVNLSGEAYRSIADAQKDELSEKKYKEFVATAGKVKQGGISASALGLGGIPPTLDQLAGVACSRIIRSHVLSFASLRQMRFGAGPDGDAACRAVLAALALDGLARSDAELSLRANCDLVEAGPTRVLMDRRHGEWTTLDSLSIAAADDLLDEAVTRATKDAGIRWEGQVFAVEGNPAVIQGAEDDSDAEA